MNAIEQINEALKLNNGRVGKFDDPNYTLGWIAAIVDRELDKGK